MRRVMMILVVSVLTIVTMAVSRLSPMIGTATAGDEEFGFWVFVPVFVVFDVDFDGIDDNFDCDFVFCDDEDDFDFDFDRDRCEGPVCLID